jgi:hypothetical protein
MLPFLHQKIELDWGCCYSPKIRNIRGKKEGISRIFFGEFLADFLEPEERPFSARK